MASDHDMLEVGSAPAARTESDLTENDPLMSWLQSNVNTAQCRSRALTPRSEESKFYEDIEDAFSDAIRRLKGLARDATTNQPFILDDSRNARTFVSEYITRCLSRVPCDMSHPPQLQWLDHVDTIMLEPRWKEPVAVLGTLNDLFAYVATADSDGLGRPLTPPTDLVAEDFKRNFTGPGADDLRAHICEAQKSYSFASYAKVIPILQSSGSGKSRTVLQLGQKELGLMICVRGNTNRGRVSEPPRDAAAAKWLQRNMYANTFLEKTFLIFNETRSLAVWLIALGKTINAFYRAQWESFKSNQVEGNWKAFVEHVGKLLAPVTATTSSTSSPSQTMDIDGGANASDRDGLLNNIDVRAAELMDGPEFSLDAYQDYLPPALKRKPSRLQEEEAVSAADFFREALDQAFEGLSTFLKASGSQEAFFHLAIDECGELKDRLYKLRRLWKGLKGNCWMLWLDTNTEISLTYGTRARDASSRNVSGSEKLLRPFTALPQDLGLEEISPHFSRILLGEASVSFGDLTELLRGMGRPLLADSHVLRRGIGIADGLSNLAEKITCGSANTLEDSRAMIALTAQRLPMVMVGLSGNSDKTSSEAHSQNRTPQRFVESLVKSHMRRLVRVSEDGKSTETSGPSEPLLSLASAHTFCEDPTRYWSAAVKFISEAKAEYGLEVGEAGEEVVRLLLAAAMDFCWVEDRTEPNLRLVRLDKLLAMLFGQRSDDHYKALLAWGRDHWLNFTHVIQSANYFKTDAPLTSAGIAEAWARQGAILGPKNQTGWDLILPIYNSVTQPTESTVFDVKKLSVIPVQTKNAAAGVMAGWNSDFSASSVHIEKPPSSDQDFCTIWFDLRGKSRNVRVTGQNRTGRSGMNQSVYRHVLAKGHDQSAIDFLSKFNRATRDEIAKLLGDHPGEEDDGFLSPHTLERNEGLLPFFQHRAGFGQSIQKP